MDTKRISAISGAALFALTASASAGPMSVVSSNVIAPPQAQAEPVYYRYRHRYGYYGWNPGAAIAGTAVGLLSLGTLAATGGWPYYGWGYGYPNYGWGYGSPYYGWDYGSPYYGSYAYYGGSYYGYPYYRHYGYRHYPHYAYYGGIHTGRSVGYGHMHYGHYGWHHR